MNTSQASVPEIIICPVFLVFYSLVAYSVGKQVSLCKINLESTLNINNCLAL